MNLIELSRYLQDESAAENYLISKGVLVDYKICPYCNSEKIGGISRNRIKCYKCRKEWHKKKGSILESKHITCAKFIGFIKLYADGNGITEIEFELEMDRKTVIQLKNIFRNFFLYPNQIIPANYDTAILYEDGEEIFLEPIKELGSSKFQCSEYFILKFTRYKEMGGIFTFLVESQWFGNKKHHYSNLDRFLSFCKMKLISYRGINSQNFYKYLFELVIRFNLRDVDFEKYLLKKLHF